MPPFLRPALLALGLFAAPGMAQVTTCAECPMPTPQDLPIQLDPGFAVTPDLLTMITMAKESDELLRHLENLVARRTNENSLRMLEQVVMQDAQGRHNLKDRPYRYAIAGQVRAAQFRARMLGEMLAVDLNNDGQVTQQELTDALSLVQVNHVAEAFFTSDKDGDSVLNAEELRDAANASVFHQMHDRSKLPQFAQLMDFDDDGALSHEEYQRGLIAMGFPKP